MFRESPICSPVSVIIPVSMLDHHLMSLTDGRAYTSASDHFLKYWKMGQVSYSAIHLVRGSHGDQKSQIHRMLLSTTLHRQFLVGQQHLIPVGVLNFIWTETLSAIHHKPTYMKWHYVQIARIEALRLKKKNTNYKNLMYICPCFSWSVR